MKEHSLRQERLKRRAKIQRIRKIMFSVFSCFVTIFVIIWLVSSVERLINWRTMELVPVTYGVLEDVTEKKIVIIRKERVFTIPEGENVKYLVRASERVNAGAMVLKVSSVEIDRMRKGTGHIFYAPCSGTLSRNVDGLETLLTPGGIFSLDLSKVYKEVTKGKMNEQSDPAKTAIKIVDNLSPSYLCFPGSGLDLKKGSQVLFRIKKGQELMSGTVVNEPQDMVIVKVATVPKDLIEDRVFTIQFVTRRKYGLIVPTSSIVKKDGKTGVYAVSGNNVQWVEVTVEGEFKEESVVSGVKPGQEIVANPETV